MAAHLPGDHVRRWRMTRRPWSMVRERPIACPLRRSPAGRRPDDRAGTGTYRRHRGPIRLRSPEADRSRTEPSSSLAAMLGRRGWPTTRSPRRNVSSDERLAADDVEAARRKAIS